MKINAKFVCIWWERNFRVPKNILQSVSDVLRCIFFIHTNSFPRFILVIDEKTFWWYLNLMALKLLRTRGRKNIRNDFLLAPGSSLPLLALHICSTISAAPRACSLACWYRIFCFSISFSWGDTHSHYQHEPSRTFCDYYKWQSFGKLISFENVTETLLSGRLPACIYLKRLFFSFLFFFLLLILCTALTTERSTFIVVKSSLSRIIETLKNNWKATLPLPSCLHTQYTKDLVPRNWKEVMSQCINNK